jgi:hypothetical protein
MEEADLNAACRRGVNEYPFVTPVCGVTWDVVDGTIVVVERSGTKVRWFDCCAYEVRLADPGSLSMREDDGYRVVC